MENTYPTPQLVLPDEMIMSQIYIIREQKVMIDKDLATLYGVETRVLKQAIKRNINRFPKDFMFELSKEEVNSLLAQTEFSDLKVFGGAKPLVFTEQGVAMLSSILNSQIAIQVNIQIIRIFVKMRLVLTDQLSVRLEIAEIKDKIQHQNKKQDNQNKNIEVIFQYLDELQNKIVEIDKPQNKIGFKPEWE
ncbi:MAG: ORF6N domain-containing protein [Bacteroidota bacterium]